MRMLTLPLVLYQQLCEMRRTESGRDGLACLSELYGARLRPALWGGDCCSTDAML